MRGTSRHNGGRKTERRARRNREMLAALLAGGACAVLLTDARPAQAAGTAANTVISNTASATYNDPNNAGTTLNATSNTVTVTVAEVAGITVGAASVTDPAHPGNILPGDVVNYDFVVTNIGNAPNTFALPGAATVTGNGTAGTLVYSTDGGATFPAPRQWPGDAEFRRHAAGQQKPCQPARCAGDADGRGGRLRRHGRRSRPAAFRSKPSKAGSRRRFGPGCGRERCRSGPPTAL